MMNHPFSFFLFPFFSLLFFPHSAVRKPKSVLFHRKLGKDSHRKIDTVDDERYDAEVKVAKNERELLVFVMEMNTSLSLCQNFYGSQRRLYFTWDNLQPFEDQMLHSHLNPPSEIIYLRL